MIWGGICLMRELECNRALLTMGLISDAYVSMPAFELQDDSFNNHHDINLQKNIIN